jgi:hypothetical protein
MTMKLGDGLSLFLTWLWVTIAVGPWWVGMAILVVGVIGNLYHDARRP